MPDDVQRTALTPRGPLETPTVSPRALIPKPSEPLSPGSGDRSRSPAIRDHTNPRTALLVLTEPTTSPRSFSPNALL